MKRILGALGGVVVLLAAVVAAAGTANGTSSPRTYHVRGTQTVVDENAGTYRMHGALVGAWATTSFAPTFESDTLFVGVGTERFRGCVDTNRNRSCQDGERHGAITFSFTYWANYDRTTGAFLHGQCVHPVTGGSGGFAGASGLLLMNDTVHGDTVVTTYKGQLQFGASGAAAQRVPAAPAAAPAVHRPAC